MKRCKGLVKKFVTIGMVLICLTGCKDMSYDAVVYMGETSLNSDNVAIDVSGKKLVGYEWNDDDLILHFEEKE